ncbi:MAG: hypothetical protein FJ144_26940 [Deltaproteobacteria bacterium]|nr:hypothetical protein [Deltaproteobacteria bacterium]
MVWLPGSGRQWSLGEPPSEALLAALRAAGVPIETGSIVIGTWESHAQAVLSVLRRLGADRQLTFNRGALMVMPSDVNKATGTLRALLELGRSPRNLIAFGDAENDLPLLALAEVGVAVAGSVPSVLASADVTLSAAGPAAVAQLVHSLVRAGSIHATPPRQTIVVGRDDLGGKITVPGSGSDVLISGDPHAGKSWLAGLMAERLVEAGYRFCLIDPEGDHAALGTRPGVLLLGGDLRIPDAGALARVVEREPLSLVLNLSSLPPVERLAYVSAALREIEDARARSGIPQWILVDEAHFFFRKGAPSCDAFLRRTGSYLLSTYRPSLLDPCVSCNFGTYFFAPTSVEEERYFVNGLLHACGPREIDAASALLEVTPPRFGFLRNHPAEQRWRVFTAEGRTTPHAHHARKYADTHLPDAQAFRFVGSPGNEVAHNVREFVAAVRTVPIETLRHHLVARDFSRWVEEVLGDRELARGLAKLESTTRAGASPSRSEIENHVRYRYALDEPPTSPEASPDGR